MGIRRSDVGIVVRLFRLVLYREVDVNRYFRVLRLIYLGLAVSVFPVLVRLASVVKAGKGSVACMFLLRVIKFAGLVVNVPRLFVREDGLCVHFYRLSIRFQGLFRVLVRTIIYLVRLLTQLLRPLRLLMCV